LSWWAILPALAFVVFEFVLGWRRAYGYSPHSHRWDDALTYLIVEFFGAMAISLPLAWIAHRVVKRSSAIGTIVFTVVLAMASFVLCLLPERAPHVKYREFPMAGFKVAPLVGWEVFYPYSANESAMWGRIDPRTNKAGALVSIALEKPGPTAADAARKLAENWKGRLVDTQLLVDGEPAYEVRGDPKAGGMHPVEAVAVTHDGVTYLIVGSEMPGTSCHDQMVALTKTWKWIPAEPVQAHLEFGEPGAVLEDHLMINGPRVMHIREKTDITPHQLQLELFNPIRADIDLVAIVQYVELLPGDSIEGMKERLGKGMSTKLKLTAPFKWRDLTGAGTHYVTDVVYALLDGNVTGIAWALVRLDGSGIAVINFSVNTPRAEDRRTYADLAERMVKTVSSAKGTSEK